jgi:hypothetical protein
MNNINQQIKKFIFRMRDEKRKMKLNCTEKIFCETYLTRNEVCGIMLLVKER